MALLIALVLCGADAEKPKEEFVSGMLLIERSDKQIVAVRKRTEVPAGFGGFSLPPESMESVDFQNNMWPAKLPPFGVAVFFAEKKAPLVKGDIIFQVGTERVGDIASAAKSLKKPGRKTIRFQRYDSVSGKWLIKSTTVDE